MNTLINPASSRKLPPRHDGRGVHDVSGFEVFSQGETGYAHALAHRLFDSGQLPLGHRLLGEWLAGHQGRGSDWVHLQFHMAVFELALDDWDGAYVRFLTQVLPAAATTTEALTDAPALLWRLAIQASEPVALPWQPLYRTALASIEHAPDPFVQIHHLLALAGAGDAAGILGWLQRDERDAVVERFGLACAALAKRAYAEAGSRLMRVIPELPRIGGSHAQGQLFNQLAAWAGGDRPLPANARRMAA